MSAEHQVGQLNGHASLWSGTAASRVDLHPSWAQDSTAYGVSGNEQAGIASPPGTAYHAVVWHGSASSVVDLHPAGFRESEALADADGQQGGYVRLADNSTHAALWSGSAASFLDMNPTGAIGSSISAMWPGQQVGAVGWPGGATQVGYWSGTPDSFVSLQPANMSNVQMFATCGSAQAGIAANHAAVWFGSASSIVNLATFLPAGQYFQSGAQGVGFSNGQYYVSGWATRSSDHVTEAWVWVGVPGPGSAWVGAGVLALGRRRAR
jgi:hypothetical protein